MLFAIFMLCVCVHEPAPSEFAASLFRHWHEIPLTKSRIDGKRVGVASNHRNRRCGSGTFISANKFGDCVVDGVGRAQHTRRQFNIWQFYFLVSLTNTMSGTEFRALSRILHIIPNRLNAACVCEGRHSSAQIPTVAQHSRSLRIANILKMEKY